MLLKETYEMPSKQFLQQIYVYTMAQGRASEVRTEK